MTNIEDCLCMGCMSKLDENGKCRCGFDENEPCDEQALPLRTIISQRYIIGRELRRDGEGIQYIAFDMENEEKVFIKEYFPFNIAHRNEITNMIAPLSEYEVQYKMMMSDYSDLFLSLMKITFQEYLIPVVNVLYENNTCYVVFKYIKTISYGDFLAHNGGEFSWPQVKKLFMPFFTQLTHLHSAGFVHRGLSPETIRVNSKGKLLLDNFGTSDLYLKGSLLEPTLFQGYAAPEQYSGSNWQGIWTDVYGVAAVMYKSLTGTLPMSADDRMVRDELVSPESLENNIPSNVSDAILNAMTLDAEYRLKSIDDFTAELLESVDSNTLMYSPKDIEEEKHEVKESTQKKVVKKRKDVKNKVVSEKGLQLRIPWGLVACIVFFIILLIIVTGIFNSDLFDFNKSKEKGNTDQLITETNSDKEPDYMVTCPNFIGRLRSNVEGNELYSQFTLNFVEEKSQSYSEGMIFEQSISYRTKVPEGTVITLKVSTGPEKVSMPNVIGDSLEVAQRKLDELGISYLAIPNYSTDYEYMIVFEQSVKAGEDVVAENNMSKVTIYYGATDSSIPDSPYNDGSSTGRIVIG